MNAFFFLLGTQNKLSGRSAVVTTVFFLQGNNILHTQTVVPRNDYTIFWYAGEYAAPNNAHRMEYSVPSPHARDTFLESDTFCESALDEFNIVWD